jgi:hypothetical protein
LDYQKLKKILKDEAKTKGAPKDKSKDKKDKKDKKANKHGGSKDHAENDGSNTASGRVATNITTDATPSVNEKSVLLELPRPQSTPPNNTTAAANDNAVDEEGSITKSNSWLNPFSVSGISPEGGKAADVTLDPVVERVNDGCLLLLHSFR